MRKLMRFEGSRDRMAPWHVFRRRLSRNVVAALVVLGGWLAVGMALYASFGAPNWQSAFESAAMIASGMGPLSDTPSAGVAGGLYAVGSMFVDFIVPSLALAPVFHRLLHKFHIEDRERAGNTN
jgi:sterol desaturase/sphingolipid hydroxylase (fatty acid hydroxylase superfamily)